MEGEVQHPQVVQKLFKTLDAMADYIRTFGVQGGQWYPVFSEPLGDCFLLEYNSTGRS